MPSSYSPFYAVGQVLLRKVQLGSFAQGSRLGVTVASVRDSSTAATHTDRNEIFKIRKIILVPQQIYFTYPHNLWPLGKLGLKQLDLDVFLYSDSFDVWPSISAIIIFWQVHDLLVSVVKLGRQGFGFRN